MIDNETLAKLIAPIVSLIGTAIIKFYSEGRIKIITFVGHISSFTIKQNNGSQSTDTNVFTHSIVVRNVGKRTAKNVRLGHNLFPQNYNVFPSIHYLLEQNPDGKVEIVFPTLVPKEQVTVSYLYFPPITVDRVNSYEKHDDGFTTRIDVIQTSPTSKTIRFLIWTLAFVGTTVIIYWVIRMVSLFAR